MTIKITTTVSEQEIEEILDMTDAPGTGSLWWQTFGSNVATKLQEMIPGIIREISDEMFAARDETIQKERPRLQPYTGVATGTDARPQDRTADGAENAAQLLDPEHQIDHSIFAQARRGRHSN